MSAPTFTTAPVDWDGPWGGNVHVAAWAPDRHTDEAVDQ